MGSLPWLPRAKPETSKQFSGHPIDPMVAPPTVPFIYQISKLCLTFETRNKIVWKIRENEQLFSLQFHKQCQVHFTQKTKQKEKKN